MRRSRLLIFGATLTLALVARGAETPEPADPETSASQEMPASPEAPAPVSAAPAASPAPPADSHATAREALELEARKEALRLLERDLARTLEELATLRAELGGGDGQPGVGDDLATLVAFYQAMKPKNAARLLERLPLQLAADVLGAMSPRAAGKILNSMQEDRAVSISRRMAGREK